MTTIGSGKKTVTLAVTKPDVTVSGKIDAIGAAGSYAYTGGPARDVEAAVFGPKAGHFTLTIDGEVLSKGSTAADFGIVLGARGTLNNKGEIEGGGGVLVNGAARISNSGTIDATKGAGLDLAGAARVTNAGTIKAATDGLYLRGGGTVTNTGLITGKLAGILGSGTIDVTNEAGGTIAGIQLSGTGYIANAGIITGGILAGAYATAENSGVITSARAGAAVSLGAAGNFTNAGTVTGVTGGVYLTGDAAFGLDDLVVNSGLITASQTAVTGPNGTSFSQAIELLHAGTVMNEAGGIVTDTAGIGIEVAATPISNATIEILYDDVVINLGSIAGRYGVEFAGLGGVTNSGTISGFDAGVLLTGTWAGAGVTNSGEITADGAPGTILIGGYSYNTYSAGILALYGTVDNTTLGTVSDALGTGIKAVSVNNYGLVTGAIAIAATGGYVAAQAAMMENWGTAAGVQFGAYLIGATDSGNQTSGLITASGTGVFIYQGNFTNFGTILGGQDGIYVQNGAQLYNNGLIHGAGDGIYGHVSHIGPLSVDNASQGVITGNIGVSLSGKGSVFNRGTISGASHGVVLSATQSLTNEGTISSVLVAGDGFITNTKYDGATGTIGAVTFAGAGTLDNAASVGSVVFDTPGLGNRVIVSAGGPENTATFGAGINLKGGVLEYDEFVDAIAGKFTGYSEVLLNGGAVYVTSALTIAATAAVESLYNARLVEASGGSLTILGSVAAGVEIDAGAAAIVLNGALAKGAEVDFTGSSQTLDLGDPHQFAGFIVRFARGDTVALTTIAEAGVKITSFDSETGVLTLSEPGGVIQRLTFNSPDEFGTETFALETLGGGTGIILEAGKAGAIPKAPAAPDAGGTIHGSRTLVTLTNPSVTTTGKIVAYGFVPIHPNATATVAAAVYGPAAGTYTLSNEGRIVCNSDNAYAAGIVFGATGTILNAATIFGPNGIEIFGTAPGALVENSHFITATGYTGVSLKGAGRVINTGSISARFDGVVLAGGGDVDNAGQITAGTGIIVTGGTASMIGNTGYLRADDGIVLNATGTAINAGTIEGLGIGIGLNTLGVAENSGLISSTTGGIVLSATAGTVVNTGTILSAQDGISDFVALPTVSGTAYITQSGTIDALRGIDLEIEGNVLNTGVILSGGLFGGSGIIFRDGGDVRNSGLIDGFSAYDGRATVNNTARSCSALILRQAGSCRTARAASSSVPTPSVTALAAAPRSSPMPAIWARAALPSRRSAPAWPPPASS